MSLKKFLIATFLLAVTSQMQVPVDAEELHRMNLQLLSQGATLVKPQTDQKKNQQSAEDYFKLGVSLNDAKQWEEAMPAFQQAIRLKPDYAEAHYKLGVAFFNLDRFEDAIERFKAAIRFKKDYADAYFNLGMSLFKLERWQEAIDVYQRELPYNSKDPDLYYAIALAYDYLEQIKKATSFYKQAIALKADHAKAHLGLGLIYDNSGHHAEAVEENKKAIAAVQDYADAYYNLAIALANLGRWNECVEAYTNALRFYPFYLRFRPTYARAYAYLSLGNGKAAAEDARTYIRLKGWSDEGTLYMVIVAYLGYRQAKDDNNATNILNDATRQYKTTADIDIVGTEGGMNRQPTPSWPYPLIQYFRRELTSQTITNFAKNDGQIIQLKTYTGLNFSLLNDRANAIASLRWVKAKGPQKGLLNEYRLALAELNRLEK